LENYANTAVGRDSVPDDERNTQLQVTVR